MKKRCNKQKCLKKDTFEQLRHKKIKSSLYSRYYTEACNQGRDTSPRLSAWATQKRHSGGEPLPTVNQSTTPHVQLRWACCCGLSPSQLNFNFPITIKFIIQKSVYDIKPTATSPHQRGQKAHIIWTRGQGVSDLSGPGIELKASPHC